MITLAAGVLSWSIVGTVIGLVAAVVGFVVPVKPGQRSVVNAVLIGHRAQHRRPQPPRAVPRAPRRSCSSRSPPTSAPSDSSGAERSTRRAWSSSSVPRPRSPSSAPSRSSCSATSPSTMSEMPADHTRDGLDALGDGDITAARTSFEAAAASFDAADRRIDSPITAIARWVPGVAQHHRVATELDGERRRSEPGPGDPTAADRPRRAQRHGRTHRRRPGRALQAPLRDDRASRSKRCSEPSPDVDSPWLAATGRRRTRRLTANSPTSVNGARTHSPSPSPRRHCSAATNPAPTSSASPRRRRLAESAGSWGTGPRSP